MADWSSLPHEIWGLILEKILQDEELLLEDFFRCGRVCSLWSSIVRHRFSKPQFPWLMHRLEDASQFPWLMHRLEDASQFPSDLWGFLDIATNRTYKSHLPELNGYIILASSDGWLIVLHLIIGDLLLFNPFSRAQIQLPDLDNSNIDHDNIYQVYLSVSSEGGYTVVIDLFTRLSYVRAGDKAWTPINFPEQPIGYRKKGSFCKGLFYLLYNDGPIISFDLDHSNNPCPLPLQMPPQLSDLSPSKNIEEVDYLVVVPDEDQLIIVRLTTDSGEKQVLSDEDEDPLIMDREQVVPDEYCYQGIMVRQTSDSDEGEIVPIMIRRMPKAKTINIFRLDPEETMEMRNLGKYSLFLFKGTSGPSYNVMCVTHAQGLIKENHVYVADEEYNSLSVFDTEFGQCINTIRMQGRVWISPVIVKL